jgi:hypothetical protein
VPEPPDSIVLFIITLPSAVSVRVALLLPVLEIRELTVIFPVWNPPTPVVEIVTLVPLVRVCAIFAAEIIVSLVFVV